MDWTQFAIMFVTFVGLFIWTRTENRADMRHMDAKLESNRALTTAFHEAIREDIREFHGRLCAIEERNKGK